ADEPDLTIDEKEEIFARIDKLEENRNKDLEDVLLDILPQAFAVVKETARRLKENGQLVVTKNYFDEEIAGKKAHVTIDGDKAIWANKWMAAGNEIEWNMLHYDVQLIGGMVLHEGKVAEMATGEGKTLVATLPSYLNALADRGVHIVTVNNYLAIRDSEWMAPLMEFHGFSVDCIDKHEPHSDERMAAYNASITYGTNNEFGFDYLRDNMARKMQEQVQRRHHFAMIDEVDSVLIDDARTPLIISGPVEKGDEHEYYDFKPRVAKLYEVQRKLTQSYLNEAKKHIKEGNKEEGGLALFRAYRGLPKSKPLIKFLGETGMKQIMQKTENYYLQENSKYMPEADEPLYFTIDEKNNSVDLTEKGLDFLTASGEDPNFFILPDIAVDLDKVDQDSALSDHDKIEKKDKIIQDYTTKTQRIHTVNQLLKAYTMFEKDVDYIIVDSKVKIVDEQTGRVMEGRRYSDGLHQALEAKENVKVEDATQTYATITLQNYFRMYHKLAGMTGTAETEAGELWEIYKLDVVVIPTNKPIVRADREDLVYKTMREKYNAVVDEIQEMVKQGRPILVGTTSVENSEILSRLLKMRGIEHQVLNAKQHAKEADVVAEAGKPGTVTIATNMAGRGTDIKLAPDSKEAGGLAIIGTERHESRRVDRQLRGRSGRQGDVGSSQFFVSLEDNLMRLFGSDRIARVMDRMGLEDGEVIQHSLITKSIERAQRKVEENNFAIRKRLLEYDDVMNSQREVIYTRRANALDGERLELDLMNNFYDVCLSIVESTHGDFDGFKLNIWQTLGMDTPFDEAKFEKEGIEQLADELYDIAYARYKEKGKRLVETVITPVVKQVYAANEAQAEEVHLPVPFTDGSKQLVIPVNLAKAFHSEGRDIIKEMEKAITLAIIDQNWKEHLREMDDLKQQVQNASYEQKDPLLIYKFEALDLFKSFISSVSYDIVSFLSKSTVPVQESSESDIKAVRQQQQRQRKPKYSENKAESESALAGRNEKMAGVAANAKKDVSITKPISTRKIVGRNEKVTVRYPDGTMKKGVKFKTVEQDVRNNKCVLVEE
ncbi:MAG: preprotein translocase subunit SecA, partial [Flammeovirgaceae bacterium]